MKRRSTAAAVAARPVEFLPRRFFLLVVRETPRFALDASTTTTSTTGDTARRLPATPGVEFVALPPALLEPRGRETRLDASHTIRFCRFMNAARRKHHAGTTPPFSPSGRPRQVHFVARSRVRGDEAGVVLLLVRWRLLCLELSAKDALAPFQHVQHLLGGARDLELSLAGIARGVTSDLLFSKHDVQCDTEDADEDETKEREASCFTRITTRFLLFASPVDQPCASTPSALNGPPDVGELDRPPTVDEPEKPACGPVKDDSESLLRVSVAQLALELRQLRVAMVVKLNARPRYDDQLIIRSGVDHLDLSFDGVDRSVVARFLESCEHSSPHTVVAVHSSTGLGRAALCVACFLIKHAQFSAPEAVGWVRFCCPGAIPPWHARILETMEAALWRDGDEFQRRRLAAQDERLGMSPRSALGRLSLTTVDDLALASSASARLASQISIGKIALGRDSLLGTQKDKAPRDHEPPRDHDATTIASLASLAQIVPLYQGSGGSYRDLVASDAVLHKRRPLTQGAVGRRRLLDHHHNHHPHGDFATLHKFLHQSSTPVVHASSSVAATARAGGTTYSASHVTPQRPATTAPDRSSFISNSSTTRGAVATQQHSFD